MRARLYLLLPLLLTACGHVNPTGETVESRPTTQNGFVTVKSAYIHSVNFDEHALTVRFHNGAETAYLDVPRPLYKEFMTLGAKLGFLTANIKPHHTAVYIRDSRLRRSYEGQQVAHLRYRWPNIEPSIVEN